MRASKTFCLLFTQGREIAANATEHLVPVGKAEGTRHFLFELHQADVVLRLIVVKRNGKIMHKVENRSLLGLKTQHLGAGRGGD